MSTAVVSGQPVIIRLLEPGDRDLICGFYHRLSPRTVYLRFMSPVVPPAEGLVRRLLDVDHCRREALIALDRDGVAGVVRYAADGAGGHEVAIVVADHWHRKGLGTMLMKRLSHIARARGITQFHATVLPENRAAMLFLQQFSVRTKFQFIDGMIEADVPLRAA